MFIDYRRLVLQDYQQKKLANTISINLIHPTPAGIRNECIEIYKSKYDRKDENCLKSFFGQYDDKAGCLKTITRFEIDKFKPLVKFLKGQINDTAEKNIELLAWLIDFEPRPFEFGKDYLNEVIAKDEDMNGKINTNVFEQDDKEEDKEDVFIYNSKQHIEEHANPLHVEPKITDKIQSSTSQTFPDRQHKPYRKRTAVIAAIIFLFVGSAGFGYWQSNHKTDDPTLSEQGQCMCWVDDHYEPIACNQKSENKILVPYDSVKLICFKKITRPDTITLKAKGFVWYTKINGNIEFYTSDGFHPIDTQLRLKPITDYIIRKYIYHEKIILMGNIQTILFIVLLICIVAIFALLTKRKTGSDAKNQIVRSI